MDADIDKPVVPAEDVWIFSIDKLGAVPIPTPPVTTKAPVVVDVEGVDAVAPTNPDVTAVALTLPENISVAKTLVLGLNVRLASDDRATPDAPLTGENVMKWFAEVVADTVFTFCDVVAVPVRFPVTFPVNVPKKLVAVNAVPV